MNRIVLGILTIISLACLFGNASADEIIDGFAGNQLSSAWVFTGGSQSNVDVSNGCCNFVNTAGGAVLGPWSLARMQRAFNANGDFDVYFRIGYTREQYKMFIVGLRSSQDSQVIGVRYWDSPTNWVLVQKDDTTWLYQHNTSHTPQNVRITRHDDTVRVYWDDTEKYKQHFTDTIGYIEVTTGEFDNLEVPVCLDSVDARSSVRAPRTLLVPQEHPTIQAGINAAANGDTVMVAPGVYPGGFSLRGKPIVLKSSNGPKGTIIDGAGFNNTNAALRIDSGETNTTVVEGFTFTGGGIALFCTSNSTPTIRRNIFNQQTYGGWAAVVLEGAAKFYNNTISNGANGGIAAYSSSVDIRNNIIVNNANYGIFSGGASLPLHFNNVYGNSINYSNHPDPGGTSISADPLFSNSVDSSFHLLSQSPCINAGDPNPIYNDPDGSRNDMGAIPYVAPRLPRTLLVPSEFFTIQSAADFAIDDDTILVASGLYMGPSENLIDDLGKKLTIVSSAGSDSTILRGSGQDQRILNLKRSKIVGFTVEGGEVSNIFDLPSYGGALRIIGDVTVEECLFRNNSGDIGGAVGLSGHGVFVNCIFTENAAYCDIPFCAGLGGAVYLNGNSSAEFRNCTFENNVAEGGSAIACWASSHLELLSCLFSDHQSQSERGLIYAALEASVLIQGSTITGTSGVLFLGDGTVSSLRIDSCLLCYNETVIDCTKWSPVVSCSNIFGNSSGNFVGCLAPFANASGNVSANPLFCDTGAGDFRVKNSSPCLPANNSCGVQIGAFGEGCLNLAPSVASPLSDTATEFQSFVYHAAASDSDGPSISYSVVNKPSWLTSNADSIFGTPVYGNSDTSFTVIASDGFLSDTQVVQLTVLSVTPQVVAISIDGSISNQHVLDHTPLFQWENDYASGPAQISFEFAVGTDNNWAFAEKWNPAPFATSDTFVVYDGSTLVDGATYYVRMRVSNGITMSPWKETTFRLNSPPGLPVPASPVNDTVASGSPLLWVLNAVDPNGDTLWYAYELYADSNMTSLIRTQEGVVQSVDSTGWAVTPALDDNLSYWWRARATDGFEISAWTALSKCVINAINEAPSAFTIVSPPLGIGPVVDLTPTFRWNVPYDPDPGSNVRYILDLSLTPSFTFVFSVDSIAADSLQLTDSLPFGAHYWWRVKAIDQFGAESPYSNVLDFWTWVVGDLNFDQKCDIADLTSMVDYLFITGTPLNPTCAGDVNDSGTIDIADLTALVDYLFINGTPLIPSCQ